MKRFLERALGWSERRLFAQVHANLEEINGQLATVTTRLDEVQALVEQTAARAATSSEQGRRAVESEARTTRRFEEIERMLGATPPGLS